MEIFVYSIQKSQEFQNEIENYIKMSQKFAKISDFCLFNDKISRSQNRSKELALRSYDEIYEPKISGFCVGLDENGENLNSFDFANLIQNRNKISFFIGGAYGFSQNFKSKMDKIISLSRLTFAHKIAKLVLFEQIFRAVCINNNHPYHK